MGGIDGAALEDYVTVQCHRVAERCLAANRSPSTPKLHSTYVEYKLSGTFARGVFAKDAAPSKPEGVAYVEVFFVDTAEPRGRLGGITPLSKEGDVIEVDVEFSVSFLDWGTALIDKATEETPLILVARKDKNGERFETVDLSISTPRLRSKGSL